MCARPRFLDVLAHVRAVRPDIPDPIAAIDERRLVIDGVIVTRATSLVRADASVVVREKKQLAGHRKLDAALAAFRLDVSGATCVDLGAAAGGFTRSLLAHGARRVYTLDVGFGQLRGQLRADPRVIPLERTNLADARRRVPVSERIDVLTADLSFISLSNALPQVRELRFPPGAILVALVKPQFELALDRPPSDDPQLERSFTVACDGASRAGWAPIAGMRSPVRGAGGAREFFLLATWGAPLPASSLGGMGSLERVQAVRDRLMSTGTVEGPDGGVRNIFPVAIGPREGAALRDLVIETGALRTFETGLGFAVSTLFICEGLLANGPGGTHVAMDPFQLKPGPVAGTTYAGVGLRTLEEAGVRSLVEFHEQESQIVLPRLLEQQRAFDLAFIDGSHRFGAVFLDLVYAGRLVPEGGVVFVDDTQLPPVRRSVEFCVQNLGWVQERPGREDHTHEWSVLRTGPQARLERPFTEFTDFRIGEQPRSRPPCE